jgi:putative DNA primase/helicase
MLKRISIPDLVLDPRDPLAIAHDLIAAKFTDAGGNRTLHRHRGGFYVHDGARYREATEEAIRCSAWLYLENAFKFQNNEIVPFKPNKGRVADVVSALEAAAALDDNIVAPAWLKDALALPPPNELLAVGNGLLHLPSGVLHPATATYFNLVATDVPFNPQAAAPQWFQFLADVFGDDHEAVETLQDFIGYVLSLDTTQQKILFMVGPKRSGKGTIARVITGLLGRDSVAGPTLSGLTENFGLEPLIGKPLAIVADARLSSRSDHSQVAERLLSISGEDTLTINRKNRSMWTGRLPTKLMLMTNELPRVEDSAGALASRFLVLTMTNSFYGKEDPKLTVKLLAELSGILNWAREGYLRLSQRGYFMTPASSRDVVEELELLASPVTAFVHEKCQLGAGLRVAPSVIYGEWTGWCAANGHQPGTLQTFGRDLKSAFPHIRVDRIRSDGKRYRYYEGIGLA